MSNDSNINENIETPSVESTDDLIIIHEGVKYEVPILPENPQQLSRKIEVREEAKVLEKIHGDEVITQERCHLSGDVFGEVKLKIGAESEVKSNLLSLGTIEIGERCTLGENGSKITVLGREIKIEDDVKIFGDVISEGDITVGEDCHVEGILVSNYGDIHGERNLSCRDILCMGKLYLSEQTKVKDNVIWAGEDLVLDHVNVSLGGKTPKKRNYRRGENGIELNLNVDRCKTQENEPEFSKIPEEVAEAVDEIGPDIELEKIEEEIGISKPPPPKMSAEEEVEEKRFEEQVDLESQAQDIGEDSKVVEEQIDEGMKEEEEQLQEEETLPVEEEIEETQEEREKSKEKVIEELTQLRGISPSTAKNLYKEGYRSIQDLEGVSKDELMEVEGLGMVFSEIIVESVKEHLKGDD